MEKYLRTITDSIKQFKIEDSKHKQTNNYVSIGENRKARPWPSGQNKNHAIIFNAIYESSDKLCFFLNERQTGRTINAFNNESNPFVAKADNGKTAQLTYGSECVARRMGT